MKFGSLQLCQPPKSDRETFGSLTFAGTTVYVSVNFRTVTTSPTWGAELDVAQVQDGGQQGKDRGLLLRAQAMNLFNDYGWQVSSSGGFTYSNGRTFMAQLVMDL